MSNALHSSKPAMHAPMLFNWTDERLRTLDQDQLMTLLENLDHQRAIGRLSNENAAGLEKQITLLLNARNVTKRRKMVDKAAARR